jgi:hypothetical protein
MKLFASIAVLTCLTVHLSNAQAQPLLKAVHFAITDCLGGSNPQSIDIGE